MEAKFLTDSLFGGMTSQAFKLGTVLSLGWFWERVGGCHIVYCGQDGEIDYETVQAAMNLDATDVTVPNQALPAGTIWHYVRRRLSDCGLESPDSPVTIVAIDDAGDMYAATPNAPEGLVAEDAAGGKVRLRWRYNTIREEIAPMGFRIYIGDDDGFDFESPDDTVAYDRGGNGQFEWTSDALSDGQRYRFCVRSYASGAGESRNTGYVSVVADSGGPTAVTGLTASWEVV